MADYVPPTQILPIFDSSVFNTAQNENLTYSQASGLFLTFPIAQGDETLQNITVDGVSTFNGALVMPDGTTQTSAYTGGGILAGSYTNTNITVNNQGKITALANGSGGGGGGTNAITAVVNTTDTASTLYPLLSTVGVLQTIYADNITTPFSYTPSSGTLSSKTITTTNDITVNTVSIGLGTAGISTNLNIGSNFNGVSTTGTNNMAFGNGNLLALTSGRINLAVGLNNLKLVTTGIGNTAIGYNSGNNITTGSYNCYMGYGAGLNDSGDTNSCFGNDSKCGTFNNSTAIGQSATATANYQIMLGAVGTYAPIVVMNNGCNIGGTALTTTGGITASGTQAITFGTNAPTMSGASISSSTIPIASVVGTAMDLTTNQSVGGTKIFSNTISGSINGTASTASNITLGNAGDLLYQSGTSATAKLPIGTSTYVLTSNGSIPQWTAPTITSTPTLANVLLAGNSAGATNLNMNSKNIIGCNELDVVDIVATNLIQGFNFVSTDVAEFNSCVVDTTLTSTGNATFNSGVILGAGAPSINSTSTSNPLVIQSGVGQGITLKTGGASGISTTLGSTGILTLAQPPVMSGASITSATIPIASVVGTAVVLSGTQTIAGAKTFSSAITASAGVVGNASTATTATSVSGGTVSATTGTFGTSLLSSGPLYIGSATQTLGTNSGAINFDGTTLTQLNITNNATSGDIKFFQNNGGVSLNTMTIPATGLITFPNSTNYSGSSITGCSKIQSSASLTTGLTVQNTIGNTGDLLITQSSITGTQQIVISTAPTNTTGGIVISPKGTPALTISPTGVATFTNSPILPTTAPTNTVNQLGYITTKVSTLTGSIVSGTYQNLVSGGFSLTPGIYSLQFYVQNTTTAVAGYITSMLVGLSTSTTAFVGGSNNYALGCTSTPAVIGFIVGNYSTVFIVTATTTYYFGETLVYSGIVPSHSAAGTSYCQITRIG